jgi:protein required for attachment to host cells
MLRLLHSQHQPFLVLLCLEARMTTTWILVANARNARLFANHGPDKGLELVQTCEAEELETDPPQSGRLSRRADLPRQTARGFAHRLASDLYKGRSRGRYAQAIIVAPPSFMGMLNAELDGPTDKMVSSRVGKDYTRTEARELRQHLGGCLCV